MIIRPPRTKPNLEQNERGLETEDDQSIALQTHSAALNRSKPLKRGPAKTKENEPSMLHKMGPRSAFEESDSGCESCLGPDHSSVQRPSSCGMTESTIAIALEPHIAKQLLPARQPTDGQGERQKTKRQSSAGKGIRADAHANYHALKIRNKGSKRQGRMGMRFGRRGR